MMLQPCYLFVGANALIPSKKKSLVADWKPVNLAVKSFSKRQPKLKKACPGRKKKSGETSQKEVK